MMSAAAADASMLPRSLEDVDELTEAFDVDEMYLPLPLPLVPLTIVVANAAPLLPPVSPYDDDETDLQNLPDIRILRSSRFTGPGLWPRSPAPLPQSRYAMCASIDAVPRCPMEGFMRVHAEIRASPSPVAGRNYFYFEVWRSLNQTRDTVRRRATASRNDDALILDI